MTTFNEALLAAWGEYIRHSPAVTYVELERIARKHIQVDGEVALFFPLDGLSPDEESNVLMWEGVSDAFLDHVNELTKRGFHARGSDPTVYLFDGKLINRPVWKPKGKKPANPKRIHWLPMVFEVTPPGGLQAPQPHRKSD